MSHAIRVATVGEIPPGKGKLVELGGRQVAVYNSAGVFHAHFAQAASKPAFETECAQPGLQFDAFAEDSPARLRDDPPCRVRVELGSVWLELP